HDPATIRYHLEKAWYLCQHGRPGPVWLDIPLNVQATEFDEKLNTRTFNPAEYEIPLPQQTQINEVAKKLRHAKRPVILAGSGVRSAKAETEFLALAEKWEIPILTAISGIDLLPSNHRLFFGRPGILGERAANFILQNSDLLLILGTRMGLRICGYAYEQVAREAYKIMVDIDSAELQKPTLHIDLPIHSDAGAFLTALSKCLPSLPKNGNWLAYCQELRKVYPVILPQHRKRKDYVSSYVFPELLAKTAPADAIIVTGNGTAYTSTFQAIPLKSGMRMFANAGCAAMGYGLPAAIGAAFAGSPRPVLCLTGDGSIQMNLQELQTILNYHLPIKIFVYNNAGYLSIKLTQRAFFQGHYVGCTAESGIQLPQLEKIATAYGLPFCRLNNNLEAAASLPEILARPGPELVEVMTDPFEELGPKSASKMLPDGNMVSMPLEDLAPFLPRDEFRRRMLIKPMEESCQEPPA
ncbi:MAG: thiamine pyrophosphate-binding protein, partial [Lentisphaeria bacterium]